MRQISRLENCIPQQVRLNVTNAFTAGERTRTSDIRLGRTALYH